MLSKISLVKLISITLILITCLISISAKSCAKRANNTKTGSSNSNTFTINAPSNLTATTVSPFQVNLTWQNNANNADGFELERSANAVNYTLIVTLSTNTNSYSDSGLISLTTYYYRIRCFNTIGDKSSWSNAVSIYLSPVWSTIMAGLSHTLALTTDGTVWSWGLNDAGQLGLGDSTFANRTTPSLITSDNNWNAFTNVSAISAGNTHNVALKIDGTIWSWGNNGIGQLGLGDTNSADVPTQIGVYSVNSDGFPILISADSDWAQTASGFAYNLGRKTNNTLWSWGNNDSGQLGLGDSGTYRITPTSVGTDSNWTQITVGYYHSIGIKNNPAGGGTLWSWGRNNLGELGLGDSGIIRVTPTQIWADSDWSQSAAGFYHTLAIKTNNTLWAWGQNLPAGQLGDGTTTNRTTPREIGTASDWSQVYAGKFHSLGIKTGNTLWSWGYNAFGQLGLGYTNPLGSPVTTPTQIGTDSDWNTVAVCEFHTLGIKADNTLWSWGTNINGQLGLGDTFDRWTPALIGN